MLFLILGVKVAPPRLPFACARATSCARGCGARLRHEGAALVCGATTARRRCEGARVRGCEGARVRGCARPFDPVRCGEGGVHSNHKTAQKPLQAPGSRLQAGAAASNFLAQSWEFPDGGSLSYPGSLSCQKRKKKKKRKKRKKE